MGWEIIVNFFEKFIFYRFLTKRLDYKSKIGSMLGITLVWILETYLNFTGKGMSVTIVVLSLADIIYVYAAFQGSFTQKVGNACMEPIIATVANVLTLGLISFTGLTNVQQAMNPSHARFILTSIYIIFCALLYMGISLTKTKKSYLPMYLNLLMLVVLIIATVALNQMLFVTVALDGTDDSMHPIFICACILGIVLLMFYIFDKIGQVTYEKTMLEVANRQYQMEISYIENVKDSIQALREWKHDYKQHISVIRQLLQEENYEALKAYCVKLQQEQKEVGELIVSGNTAIDALLSNKFMIAKSHHIRTDYEITISPEISIEDMDICIIIGNILDNAIEACDKLSEDIGRYISVVMKPKRNMFYISVTNSSDGKYRFNGKRLRTTKIGSDHGIGVKRVEQLAEQNRGFCLFEAKEESFTVTVVLPCHLS